VISTDHRPDAHHGLDAWHELTADQKEAEHAKQRESEFYLHPDFEPVYCMDCGYMVWPVTEHTYPHCPEGRDHYVGPFPEDWSHL